MTMMIDLYGELQCQYNENETPHTVFFIHEHVVTQTTDNNKPNLETTHTYTRRKSEST